MIECLIDGLYKKYSISNRLDIIVKYIYALDKLGELPNFIDVNAKELYYKHIHIRTGSKEPGAESIKSSIDDFINQFDQLITDMKPGFSNFFPIPISSINHLPLNGAHRIAVALAYDYKPIMVTTSENIGGTWGGEWFLDAGFSKNEIHNIIKAFSYSQNYQNLHFAILWEPSYSCWDSIELDLKKDFNLVYSEELFFKKSGFNEFVRDLYSFDTGANFNEQIERKIRLLSEHEPKCKIIVLEKKEIRDIRVVKEKIRDKFKKVNPIYNFTTLHISDSSSEYIHTEKIVLNSMNMNLYNLRTDLDLDFLSMLQNYKSTLHKIGIKENDCCIVGSSILNVFNLRKADDIDFTLLKDSRMKHFDNGVTNIDNTTDVVAYNYARCFQGKAINDTQLITIPKHHFLVRGCKFAYPTIVLTRKQYQRRPKDLKDISLLGNLLKKI